MYNIFLQDYIRNLKKCAVIWEIYSLFISHFRVGNFTVGEIISRKFNTFYSVIYYKRCILLKTEEIKNY